MSLSQSEITSSQQLVIDTFLGFRDELRSSFGNVKYTSKKDTSPVTELDVKVEHTLKEKLLAQFPTIGFHGEETDDVVGTSNALWIVDPIDGTSSFVHGLPYCTNMAALIADGDIVASVIYDFVNDELFTARRGEGAFKNGQPIRVADEPLDNSMVFSGSFAYKNLYHLLQPHGIGVYAPIGASGYEYTRLAQGNIQAVTKLNCKSQIHDNVPGMLLVQEAGGVIVPFEQKTQEYELLQLVACTPTIANLFETHRDEIKELILSGDNK
ncbi:MAG: inositol monophosphatase, monophosphatase [Candidatus Saccharibacteria bacterium]|nr:inositol monophosphatase, monophosphatase [Candidatus Saccharibacteria bacterium]